MPHDNRPLMNPQPRFNFDQVFYAIEEHGGMVEGLFTTGGVSFSAEARIARNNMRYIKLPHSNRIYHCCWGNRNNHMGNEGQRIGHYAKPLDEWYQQQLDQA